MAPPGPVQQQNRGGGGSWHHPAWCSSTGEVGDHGTTRPGAAAEQGRWGIMAPPGLVQQQNRGGGGSWHHPAWCSSRTGEVGDHGTTRPGAAAAAQGRWGIMAPPGPVQQQHRGGGGSWHHPAWCSSRTGEVGDHGTTRPGAAAVVVLGTYWQQVVPQCSEQPMGVSSRRSRKTIVLKVHVKSRLFLVGPASPAISVSKSVCVCVSVCGGQDLRGRTFFSTTCLRSLSLFLCLSLFSCPPPLHRLRISPSLSLGRTRTSLLRTQRSLPSGC